MAAKKTEISKASGLIGRALEELSVAERLAHAGTWMALQLYSPPHKVSRDGVEYVDVRLRTIEAAGESVEECVGQLRSRGLNPTEFEFTPLKPPY